MNFNFKRGVTAVATAAALSGFCGIAQSAPVQWTVGSGGNDHYYEYISTPATWQDAFNNANGSTYLGLQGYLATITSAAEDSFASGSVAGGQLAWLGGSDVQTEGLFRWVNGPENGQAFTYTNWSGGEPNNFFIGESYVQTNWSGGRWNDHGAPTFPNQANGYLVEYSAVGAVPEPETYAMMLAGLGLLGFAARRRKQKAA